MNCKFCGKPLNESQRKNGFKSCPRCSTMDGNEHIYFKEEDFGFSEKRETEKNPDGIQSYCTDHRGNDKAPIPRDGKKCSEM